MIGAQSLFSVRQGPTWSGSATVGCCPFRPRGRNGSPPSPAWLTKHCCRRRLDTWISGLATPVEAYDSSFRQKSWLVEQSRAQASSSWLLLPTPSFFVILRDPAFIHTHYRCDQVFVSSSLTFAWPVWTSICLYFHYSHYLTLVESFRSRWLLGYSKIWGCSILRSILELWLQSC